MPVSDYATDIAATYNGSNEATVTFKVKKTDGEYRAIASDFTSTLAPYTGSYTLDEEVTFTISDIGGLSAGQTFELLLLCRKAGGDLVVELANVVLVFGAEDYDLPGVTWSYNGTNLVQVAYGGAPGNASLATFGGGYGTFAVDPAVLASGQDDGSTSGTLSRAPGTFSGTPTGIPFKAVLFLTDAANDDPISIRTFVYGTADAGTLTSLDGGGGGGEEEGPVFVGGVCVKIYDLATNELADISAIALEKTWKPRHNGPSSIVIQAPAGHALLTALADDGYPNLRKGNRKLIVWDEDMPPDQPIFHGRIFTVERNGDGSKNIVTITAWDAWMELGYESDDRAGRPVRDDTGNFINPSFTPSVANTPADAISGPDLIQQILTNSQNADPLLGEGPLPIDIVSGTFDLDVPPAVDLSVLDTMDWPVLCGDFITQLVDSGVVDVVMRPVDPTEGFDPYVMVELSAVSLHGTDRSATVHFDYWTGSRNAKACRHVEEFATINNKLFMYLGPRKNTQQWWGGNIAPDSPGVTVGVDDSRDLYGGPDSSQFMSIIINDSLGDEGANRPLYLALYNAELGLRVEPRDMLYITPNPDAKALFQPPVDFDRGDLIAINTGAEFGVVLAEAQRVYGYDKSWSREGVARVSELLTSADAG